MATYENLADFERQAIIHIDQAFDNTTVTHVQVPWDKFHEGIRNISDVKLKTYIGDDETKIYQFISDRPHLWRLLYDDLFSRTPSVLRKAIIGTANFIIERGNKVHLNEIFNYIKNNHANALPYLPPLQTGASIDVMLQFVQNYRRIFRLINSEDGDNWTRKTPTHQVLVAVISAVFEDVILIDVPPEMVENCRKKSVTPTPPVVDNTPQICKGYGRISRLTSAYGHLKVEGESDTAVFFTSNCIGGGNLQQKGLKLEMKLYYEGKLCTPDEHKKFAAKWRAHLVRPCARGEDTEEVLQPPKTPTPIPQISSPTPPVVIKEETVEIVVPGASASSPSLMKMLEEELQDLPISSGEIEKKVEANGEEKVLMENACNNTVKVDAAVQTDTRDEEILLRLLRNAPELLNMLEIVRSQR